MEQLNKELEKVNAIHNETVRMMGEVEGISGALRKEYERGFEQYSGMFYSVQSFIEMSDSEETILNFKKQQVSILQNWAEYERNIQEKIKKYDIM